MRIRVISRNFKYLNVRYQSNTLIGRKKKEIHGDFYIGKLNRYATQDVH